MSQDQTKLWWRAGTIQASLAKSLNSFLADREDGGRILWSYLEWKPGTNLANRTFAPVLQEGEPELHGIVELDEIRLFSEAGGVHAVEDAGATRWMQWQIEQPFDLTEEANWRKEIVRTVESYQIHMLKDEAARRFGLSKPNLPKLEQMWVDEYWLVGALFCWKLRGKN